MTFDQAPRASTEKLISEIEALKLSGPGAAARLIQEGIGFKDGEKILREKLGFFVTVDPNKMTLSVSLDPYYGAAHPEVKRVAWQKTNDQHWLSEVE